MTTEELLELIKARIESLQSYVNEDEITHLHSLMQQIKDGITAQNHATKFLELVPVGKWDSDRRGYGDLVFDAICKSGDREGN